MTAGYYRFPTISQDRIVFVCEDDLWEVTVGGDKAVRLTAGRGECQFPVLSPDGTRLAFLGTEEGSTEVFVMDAQGGQIKQLTYWGARSATVAWSRDGKDIIFRSNNAQHTPRHLALFAVSPEGGEPRALNLGPAVSWAEHANGTLAIARNSDDLARWKRYRGGTAATIWTQKTGGAWQQLFKDETSGHCRPMWVGERLYFLNDREGHGNLYSSNWDGSDLRRETDHMGFYARFASTDGLRIVYTVGGEIWLFTPGQGSQKLEFEFPSSRTQLNRKFVNADEYLDDINVSPKGDRLSAIARGKLFNFGTWEGGVRQLGTEQGVRYEFGVWLDDESLLVTSDEGGEVHLEIHSSDGTKPPKILTTNIDIGRPVELKVSPLGNGIAFTNSRHELIVMDLNTHMAEVIDRSPWDRIGGFDFSPDGRFLVYGISDTQHTSLLRMRCFEDGATHDITSGDFKDSDPCFDPEGRYLYFLSQRFFEPVYDELFFEISFPAASKPCVVTLRKDLASPFFEEPRSLEDSGDEDDKDDKDEEERSAEPSDKKQKDKDPEAAEKTEDDKPEPIQIDFDGIKDRIQAFAAPTGTYVQLAATADRVFWTMMSGGARDDKAKGIIKYFNLKSRETKTFAAGVDGFGMGADQKTLVVWAEDGLRVLSASASGFDELDDDDDTPSRRTGWLDLGRLAVSVDVKAEWRQMLRESWRLMRDHYWSPTMAGMDWDAVWNRYLPLVDQVGSRSEFSDVVWVMQGEMGTSHAYELGGDYRRPPNYRPASLGADIVWNDSKQAYRIDHIVRGDAWDATGTSPLTRPGADIKEGDFLLAVNGRRLDEHVSLEERLVQMAGREVELQVQSPDGEPRFVTVKAFANDSRARYREWVATNRQKVHEASNGQVGYVHVPDMSIVGFAEFHRGFLTELRRQGLIVDVRFNGGGHVSQLLLEKLARKRIGYDITRMGASFPYPSDSVAGPIVAVTDEQAGSDGDIFSHCFKLMNLGTLVGKRTWGGVVGIWPRQALVDGSYTTQPEYSFWFQDVGFGVENYGTDPDIEVDFRPDQHAIGEDPQLSKALEVIAEQLAETKPGIPDFGPHPNLAPSPLDKP